MPEYLSPGVFIEEVSSGIRAIEGVSTSTAAFVGRAARGTVPGYDWGAGLPPGIPFVPTKGFVLTPDPAPILVTSFSDFQRQFGRPLPIPLTEDDPNDYGYLAWAVRAFFDNGGKRAYVARIVNGGITDGKDTPSTIRVSQGVVYRLVRSAAATDGLAARPLFLSSTRGLNVGDTLTFRRHSDGQNALGAAALPALAVGMAGPFSLKDGDQLNVTTNTPAAVLSTIIVAKPATITTNAAPFNLVGGETLLLRIGPATEPIQTVTFSTGAPFPVTSGAATAVEVETAMSRALSGVKVFVSAGTVAIESDVHGTAARIEVVSGTAAPLLGLAVGVNGPPAGGNVPDAAHVTVADLTAAISSPSFAVSANAAGQLQFASNATGAGVTIQLDEVPAGSGLLARLGFGGVATVTRNGVAAVSSTVQVAAYDLQANSIVLTAPLTGALDASDIYASVTAPTPAAGPKFFARSPGSWSADINISITNSDRAPTPVTSPIASGLNRLAVQSVSGLYVGASVEVDHDGTSRSVHQVTDINPATRVITIDPVLGSAVTTGKVRALEIDIVVNDSSGASPTEVYRGLSWNQTSVSDLRRHYAWAINARSRLVWVQPPTVGLPPLSGSEDYNLTFQPTTPDGFPIKPSPADIGREDFSSNDSAWVGVDNGPGARSGIESLKDLSEARILLAPGKSSQTIQLALIAQCELLRYRFAILDGQQDPAGGSITSILTHRSLYDTSFAALYQPWVTVTVDGQTRYLPPSGYLAGIYARIDNDRGVWKAPANEIVQNVVGLKTRFTTGEQDLLNPRGVNLIRQFDVGGIRVWGARTLSSDADVKYINVRRTLIYIEASIDQGTQWVVFEPNNQDTWTRVTESVEAFLLTQWRTGALFGRRVEDAYFVRCDESTMTLDDIQNGRLICEIGVAIVRPAEFVIFRVEQITKFGATS